MSRSSVAPPVPIAAPVTERQTNLELAEPFENNYFHDDRYELSTLNDTHDHFTEVLTDSVRQSAPINDPPDHFTGVLTDSVRQNAPINDPPDHLSSADITPGSSLPSRNSREAPPPVDI